MNFSDIKSMTFVENVVIVDGRDILISRTLDSNITAVQFHNGNNFCIEEPLMKEVPLSKYQFVLDEFEKARDILDTPKEKSLDDFKDEKLREIEEIYKVKSTESVLYNGISYKGGDVSASAILGAINLAENLQESNTKIIGCDDKPYTLTFEEAYELSALIAKKWRDAFFKYKELKVQISEKEDIQSINEIIWI